MNRARSGFILLSSLLSFSSIIASPNIVLILADDMGYGDVAALNPKSTIPTPNLDRLAKEGMTFTDAHSGSAVCTPTRYGVLTGRYCWRGQLKRGVLNGYGAPLIEKGRATVASFLKKEGYATACVGKWHLGLGFVPVDGGEKNAFDYTKPLTDGAHTRGFDYSYIIPASLDFPPYVYIKDGQVTGPPDRTQAAQGFPAYLRKGPIGSDFRMEDALDHLLERATGYLESRKESKEPFFLYFPLTAPHKPVLPHERFRGNSKLGPYGDFVMQVDATVGGVLKTLDETGLAENTLVIYTSDNGSFMHRLEGDEPGHVIDATVQAYNARHHTANGKLRGTKADVWEAGHRVPFFARWPSKIAPGSTYGAPVCHVDLFATCAEIVGKNLPNDAAEDSFSWLPAMLGKEPKIKRAPVINHSASGTFAIRDGKWKLVLGSGSGGRAAPKGKPFEKPYTLWDLSEDLSEKQDLMKKYPDIADRLEAACLRIRDSGRSR
ncbi:MAG: arylsulfatase A [Verrucomicrobiales bacterium]|jgi:arylsulfatase A